MAYSQYELNPIYDKTQVNFYGNDIVLSDQFANPSEEYKAGSVDIKVNGRDYSHSSKVEIRPMFHDANRYHGYLHLVELIDKKKNTSVMAIIQRISGIETPPFNTKELAWRLLLVARDGSVTEEVFTQLSHLENQCKTNCRAGLRSVEKPACTNRKIPLRLVK
jgi:hypothetical protein